MRAARLHEYNQPFRIEDVPDPEPGPGQVRIRVTAAGACHSDLHTWAGELPFLPPLPRILGHEPAGLVDALGPGADRFEPGEPVVVYGGWGCGACRFCLGGQEQLCNPAGWVGGGPDGCYAEYMLVPSTRHLIRIGELDPVQAAPLTDAALTPYHAIRSVLPVLGPGSTALVIGAGGLGHMAIQLLKLITPATVIVADVAADKRATALGVGADAAVDPLQPDAAAEIRARGSGEGAEAVLDIVGSDATLAFAATCLGRQSHLVLVGLASGSVSYSFAWPPETVLHNSHWGTRNELEELVGLAQRGQIHVRVRPEPLERINEVFRELQRGRVDGRAVFEP